METLMFIKAGVAEWRESPTPLLQAGNDVLVRPVAVATCDLDAAIARGHFPAAGPFPLGHEFIGVVLDAGSDVQHLVGSQVAVPFQISCGTCNRCRRGLTANCLSVPERSMYGLGAMGGDWGGALSDLVRVPFADHMAVPLPDGVAPATAASVGDNISDAWRSVAPSLAAQPGAPVLVVGGGGATSIGLYAVELALALGAEKVDYVDHEVGRLDVAAALGANAVLADGPEQAGLYTARFPHRLGPYPITVDASGHNAGLALAMRSTEPGGTCTNVGVAFELATPIPMLEAYATGLNLVIGRAQVRTAIPRVLELIADGRIHPDVVTTVTTSWEAAADVLSDPPTKAVILR